MTTLSIILFIFCLFHLSTASDYLFGAVNSEIEGVRGLNPLNDRVYFPEWNPVNDPVYEPKTSKKKERDNLLVEVTSFPEENASSSSSSNQSSMVLEQDSTSEPSVSPKLHIPEESDAFKLWYLRRGIPLSKTEFVVSACHLDEIVLAIR